MEKQLELPGIGHNQGPRLIAFYSPVMCSGKTTAAEILVEEHGFVRISFAEPIKSMVRDLLFSAGLSPSLIKRYVDGDGKDVGIDQLGGVTPRRLMQTIGTEWGRDTINQNLWTNIAMARADVVMRDGASVVFDDLRFGNEAGAVWGDGGQIYRIVRPGVASDTTGHSSEGGLSHLKLDATIYNEGTVEDLRRKLGQLINV